MSAELPLNRRPAARPETGFLAWQATLGYISAHHSPDAVLKLQIVPGEGGDRYTASVSWSRVEESAVDQPSLAAALTALWQIVDRSHILFQTEDDHYRRPANYGEREWIDADTRDILDRLLVTTRMVFQDEWQIVAFYQPTDAAEMRVQMRLLARGNKVGVGGRGPSLLEATRALFRNAAPFFAAHSGPAITTPEPHN
jgi:hypothetical protein